jgi:hypothetical protein
MPCLSESRIAANRRNAQKSTGPRTQQGKERSRGNGLKHGMTGRGVVLPAGDADEVNARAEELRADLDPKSPLGRIMVRQLATLSVRMERGERQESAAIAGRVRGSGDGFDEARLEAAAGLFQGLAGDPINVLRKLRKSPEGCDRLLAAWRDLRAYLTREPRPTWYWEKFEEVARLSGLTQSEARDSRLIAINQAMGGHFEGLTPLDGAGLDEPGRRAWARAEMLAWIDAQVAGLKAHLDSLDFEAIDQERAEAADLALFDPSRDAGLARRYESESRRGFFKALKEYRQAEAEAGERLEAEAEAEETAEPAPGPASEGAADPGEAAPVGSCRWERGQAPRTSRMAPPVASPGRIRADFPAVGRPETVTQAAISPG